MTFFDHATFTAGHRSLLRMFVLTCKERGYAVQVHDIPDQPMNWQDYPAVDVVGSPDGYTVHLQLEFYPAMGGTLYAVPNTPRQGSGDPKFPVKLGLGTGHLSRFLDTALQLADGMVVVYPHPEYAYHTNQATWNHSATLVQTDD